MASCAFKAATEARSSEVQAQQQQRSLKHVETMRQPMNANLDQRSQGNWKRNVGKSDCPRSASSTICCKREMLEPASFQNGTIAGKTSKLSSAAIFRSQSQTILNTCLTTFSCEPVRTCYAGTQYPVEGSNSISNECTGEVTFPCNCHVMPFRDL